MHGFTVDPDVLATAGDPLTDIASALVNQGNLADWTLRRAASVAGEAALAAALQQAADDAGLAFATGGGQVARVGEGLAATAANYRSADAEVRADFHR